MKEDWEWAEPPASLSMEEVNALVRPVFGGRNVTAAYRIGTGLSNSNYKLEVAGYQEPYVLRL